MAATDAISFPVKSHAHSEYVRINSGADLAAIELYSASPYIDFHFNNSNTDFSHRIIADSADRLNVECKVLAVNGNPVTLEGHSHEYSTLPRVGNDYNSDMGLYGNATVTVREHGPNNANAPENSWFFVLTNSSMDSGYGSQLAMGMTTDKIYYRLKTSDWKQISYTDHTHDYAASNHTHNYQAPLGFTPVQQGGGAGQSNNKIYLGWTGTSLNCQVDATNFGPIAFESYVNTLHEELNTKIDNLNASMISRFEEMEQWANNRFVLRK